MWPDRVSNPGPLTCESGTLPTALRGPATFSESKSNAESISMNTNIRNEKINNEQELIHYFLHKSVNS